MTHRIPKETHEKQPPRVARECVFHLDDDEMGISSQVPCCYDCFVCGKHIVPEDFGLHLHDAHGVAKCKKCSAYIPYDDSRSHMASCDGTLSEQHRAERHELVLAGMRELVHTGR